MNVMEQCRLDKIARPEAYCRVKGCLWLIVTRKGPNPCRKPGHAVPKVEATTEGEP